MKFELITSKDTMWKAVRDYAVNCSWIAGKSLANNMDNNSFTDWERVVVATENELICGYCTVAKRDCIPNVSYCPYIGYMFVGEEYRGDRLSQKLIECAKEYLKTIGFNKVYIVSNEENLYEKYGFVVIDKKPAPWNPDKTEKIYTQQF